MGKTSTQQQRPRDGELSAMADMIPVHVWNVTDSETYGRVNQHHADFFGKRKEEMEHQKLHDVLPAEVADDWKRENKVVYQKGVTLETEQWIPDRKGKEYLLSITRKPKFSEDSNEIIGIICWGINVTACKKEEKGKVFQQKRMKNVLSVSHSFINIAPQSVDGAIHQAVKQVGAFEGVDRCTVFLFDDEQEKRMSNTHEWCAPDISSQKDNFQMVPAETFQWWLNTLSRGEKICLNTLDDMPKGTEAEKQMLESRSVLSMAAVPLSAKRACKGFICFESVQTYRQWTEETIAVLQMIADIFTNALERKRLETKLLENETDFIDFIDHLDDIVIITDLEGTITHANQQATEVLDYSPEAILYLQVYDLFPLEYQKDAKWMLESAGRGISDTLRIPFVSSQGTEVPVDTRVRYGKWNGQESIFLLSRNKDQ